MESRITIPQLKPGTLYIIKADCSLPYDYTDRTWSWIAQYGRTVMYLDSYIDDNNGETCVSVLTGTGKVIAMYLSFFNHVYWKATQS